MPEWLTHIAFNPRALRKTAIVWTICHVCGGGSLRRLAAKAADHLRLPRTCSEKTLKQSQGS
jgi:hypothetical protein